MEKMSHHHLVSFFEEKQDIAFYQNGSVAKTSENLEARQRVLHRPIPDPSSYERKTRKCLLLRRTGLDDTVHKLIDDRIGPIS